MALASLRRLERQVDAVSQSVPTTSGTVSKTRSRRSQTRCSSDAVKSTMCYG